MICIERIQMVVFVYKNNINEESVYQIKYTVHFKSLTNINVTMPTWNQIQSQLRNPNNPVVFIDVSVGTTVCKNEMFAIVRIVRLCRVS